MKELPFYIESNECKLFCVLHSPEKLDRNVGIIVCCPFAEEKLWSHRVIVNLARYMAKKGIIVIRFDYMGHGDSEGNFENASIKTRISDINALIQYSNNELKLQKIGLLGLRFGATLATITAMNNESIDFLVLWEPILNGNTYMQQCLRSNLATQMAVYKKIKYTRNDLVKQLLNGININIDGYLISKEFYEQAKEINLLELGKKIRIPTQIINITKNVSVPINNKLKEFYSNGFEELITNNIVDKVIDEPFWFENKLYYQTAPSLYRKTFAWIKNITN